MPAPIERSGSGIPVTELTPWVEKSIIDNSVLRFNPRPEKSYPYVFLEAVYGGAPMVFKRKHDLSGLPADVRALVGEYETVSVEKDMRVGFLNSRFTTAFSEDTVEGMIRLHSEGKSLKEVFERCSVASFPDYDTVMKQPSDEMRGGYKTGFLGLVDVNPLIRGHYYSTQLIHKTLDLFRSRGIDYALVYTILPGLSDAFPDATEALKNLPEYLTRKQPPGGRHPGLHPDYGVLIHQHAGAIIPTFGVGLNTNHPESFNNAGVGVYDLRG